MSLNPFKWNLTDAERLRRWQRRRDVRLEIELMNLRRNNAALRAQISISQKRVC